MSVIIVSTVGTSLLTNGAPSELREVLLATANLPEGAFDPPRLAAVRARAAEAEEALRAAGDEEIRRMSAELNGILALDAARPGVTHYLLHTDTLQGSICAGLAAGWLARRRCRTVPVRLERMSTASPAAFAQGVDYLLGWADLTLPALRRQGRRIIFNLVGGFKAVQAYCQTLGMFYADEIVYLFEGSSELIRIPRLPLAWETEALQRHAAAIARLVHAGVLPAGELAGLPEAYLTLDGDHATLSDWGLLAWKLHREQLLSGDLLAQPGLHCEDTFRRDYDRRRDRVERAALQEALGEVAVLWARGGLQELRQHTALRYENYRNRDRVGHFRLVHGMRVSCRPDEHLLRLRRWGPHDSVNDDP